MILKADELVAMLCAFGFGCVIIGDAKHNARCTAFGWALLACVAGYQLWESVTKRNY